MRSHDIDYEILGASTQLVEITLDPGESVIAEAGTMSYMDANIAFETRLGDGSNADAGVLSKLFSAGKRLLTGESLFLTHFRNDGKQRKQVGFAAPYPGTVLAIDLAKVGEQITCQKDSFLCAALGTKIDIAFNKRLGAGFFGGEGFILQRLQGDGKAFIHAGGTLIEKPLNDETLLVDTGCLVAFTSGIQYDIRLTKGLRSMLFGNEGLFLAELSGTGTVWLQSLPFSRLADRILAHAPKQGGEKKGET